MKLRVPSVIVLPALFLILLVALAGCISQAPPATSVPADFPGMLNITSTPSGAAVYIDTGATPSGTTPAVFTLSPITHPIMLRFPGYRDYATSVIIPPGSHVSFSAQMEPASPALPLPGSTQEPGTPGNQTVPVTVESPGSRCDPRDGGPRVPVPVDTSVPIQDPMPGIRYSLVEGDSGRTIEIGRGDVFEITLRWAPSVAWDWNIPVSGCGLEMVNAGYYDTGTDYWNQSGHYRARYRAVRTGTSFIDGIFGVPPGGTAHEWNPKFNLTVIVK